MIQRSTSAILLCSCFASIVNLAAISAAADTFTRPYDVSDLVTPHPSHALPTDAQSAQGVEAPPTSDSHSEQVRAEDQLLDSVRAALSIEDVNSKAVKLIGSTLVVTEPADAQAAVAKLLDELRSKSNASVQICVDAVWALAPTGPLPDAAALAADPNAAIARARTVGFNGQTIGVRQVKETPVVSGATPIIGSNVSVNQYQTEIDRPGLRLQVTPRVQNDGSVVVDLISELNVNLNSTLRPTTRPEDGPVLRPEKLIQSIATTVALRPGEPTIVGGITQDATQPHGKTLCLVLTSTVVPPAKAAR